MSADSGGCRAARWGKGGGQWGTEGLRGDLEPLQVHLKHSQCCDNIKPQGFSAGRSAADTILTKVLKMLLAGMSVIFSCFPAEINVHIKGAWLIFFKQDSSVVNKSRQFK